MRRDCFVVDFARVWCCLLILCVVSGTAAGQVSTPTQRQITSQLQALLDKATADGLAPRAAHNSIVEAVISAALEQQNPDLLNVLDNVNAKSGPLGNIHWVKAKVMVARSSIASTTYTAERTQRLREQWVREDAKRSIMSEAYAALLSNPSADITLHVEAALQSGNPELAMEIIEFKQTLLDRAAMVRTDSKTFNALLYRIHEAESDAALERLAQDVFTAGNERLLTIADFERLMDAIDLRGALGFSSDTKSSPPQITEQLAPDGSGYFLMQEDKLVGWRPRKTSMEQRRAAQPGVSHK